MTLVSNSSYPSWSWNWTVVIGHLCMRLSPITWQICAHKTNQNQHFVIHFVSHFNLEWVEVSWLITHSKWPPKHWILDCQCSLKDTRTPTRGHNKPLLIMQQIFHGDVALWKCSNWIDGRHCCKKLDFTSVVWERCCNRNVRKEDCGRGVEFHWTMNASIVEKVKIVLLDEESRGIPKIKP